MKRHTQTKAIAMPAFEKEKRQMTCLANACGRLLNWGGSMIALPLVVVLVVMAGAAPASADFGLNNLDLKISKEDTTPARPGDDPVETQAGSHPFAVTSSFGVSNTELMPGKFFIDEEIRNLIVEQMAGFSGDATAYPRCSTADFIAISTALPECPDKTAIGVIGVNLLFPPPVAYINSPVYNLDPPPGAVLRLGFVTIKVPTVVDVSVKEGGDYNALARMGYAPQPLTVFGGALQLWGNPADPIHDPVRGHCVGEFPFAVSLGEINYAAGSTGSCSESTQPAPLLTLPTSCASPGVTAFMADSWQNPGEWVSYSVTNHDGAEPPNPQSFTGCDKLRFSPRIEAQTTTEQAETGSGLNFNVDFNDEGLTNENGLVQSTTKKTVITLPEGVTINPSVGEGLGVCTPADLGRETLASNPGDGCPNASKVGTLHVDFPIIEEPIEGSVYLAQQDDPATTEPGAENPFDSLIAMYFVLKNANLGVNVKLPVLVEPDPITGQLVVTLDDIPQFPFSHFNAHLREGQRAPLVAPATCGTYTTEAKFYPRSDPTNPRTVTSSFEITNPDPPFSPR